MMWYILQLSHLYVQFAFSVHESMTQMKPCIYTQLGLSPVKFKFQTQAAVKT